MNRPSTSPRRVLAMCATAICVAAVALPATASASTVTAQHAHSTVTLFPSNDLTVRDFTQITGRRVALPLPDCGTHPTDCNTVRLLDKLDGFDLDPQIALTFDHSVDATAVAAATTVTRAGGFHSTSIGVDRVVYDSSTNTVYAHPSAQLAPDTTYLLRLRGDRHNGIPNATTTFTTESATTGLLRMRTQLDSGLAYALAGIAPDARGLQVDANVPAAGTTLTYTEDQGTAGGLHTVPVPITSGTGAARYIFGSFLAPNWLDADSVIPQTADAGLGPIVPARRRLPFVLIVPAGRAARRLAGGDIRARLRRLGRQRVPRRRLNASTASRRSRPTWSGTASARASTWNITTADGTTLSVPAHARGSIRTVTASSPAPKGWARRSSRRPMRRTPMPMGCANRRRRHDARPRIGRGLDVDGDGHNDLRRTGVELLRSELRRHLRRDARRYRSEGDQVLALNVSGGPISEIARLSPSFRLLVTQDLSLRQPSLLNGGYDGFTESMPLRGAQPVLDPAPGADRDRERARTGDMARPVR